MQASLKNRQRKMSNPPTFIWEPEPLVLDPVVDLQNAFSNLFLLLPALPHVHYKAGVKRPRAEQTYTRLPSQPLQTLQPIGLPSLLVYSHRVDPSAPLGSFENPYSSSDAFSLLQPYSNILSPPNPVDILKSSESTDIIEPLEPRPPTPPKRSLRRSSDERQQTQGSPTQLESVQYTLPPAPANQSQNTRQLPFTRNSSHPNLQLRPQQPEISTGPPLHTPHPLRS